MIDDESKKFIKETIENAVDNKLSEHEKKTEAKKRLDELKYEKRSLEDRKKLLAELDNKEKKGQATIAERFEKLKLSVDTAIPQDFKDAWKTTKDGVSAGTSQVGKGLGTLTAKAMMSNPLTAFLYQNRDVLGAVKDIGVGSVKAGLGALKGVGHGALGLANSVKNMFHKGEEEEQIEELNLPKTGLFNSETSSDKIVKEKNGWQKKIDVIHEIITRDLIKEQKKSSQIMGKGLGGLNKTMEAVKGFTDMIAAKQKLILGGIMLGAAAIAGLVVWFKSGGLANLLNPKNIHLNKKGTKEAETKLDQVADPNTIYTGGLKPELVLDQANKTLDKNNTISLGEVKRPSEKLLAQGGLNAYTKELKKDKTINEGTAHLLFSKFNYRDTRTDYNRRDYKNDKGGTKLSFPVIVRIKEIELSGNKEEGSSILLENKPGWNGKKADLLITNMKQILVPMGEWIPAKTAIGMMGEKGQIFGDIDTFLEGETSFEEYTNKNMKDSSEIDKNFNEFANTDKATKAYNKTWKKLSDRAAKNAAWQEYLNNPIAGAKNSIDIIKDTVNGDEQKEEGVTTGQAAPLVSQNQIKAKEQNETLNKKPEEVKRETGTTEGQGYRGQLPTITLNEQSKDTEYSHADLRPTSDIALMISDTTTNTGAI